jgi:hypothetical protein
VNLTGGFYDAGDNMKFGFPGAYALTLLSWSVVEYRAKFEAAGELDHARSETCRNSQLQELWYVKVIALVWCRDVGTYKLKVGGLRATLSL